MKKKQPKNYLSEDLIIQEILTRLPVKSVLRFKSVSKQWYSTLSSSNFANAHRNKSPLSHRSDPVINTLFIKNLENYYLCSCDEDRISGNFEDNLFKLDVEFGIENEKDLQLVGCCNGLICLTISYDMHRASKFDDSCLIFWNPATRKLHRYESDGYLKRIKDVHPPYVARGFGYASSVDDYKYVRILTSYGGNKKSVSIVHIFSLRENKWRKFDIAFDSHKCTPQGRAVLIDEKLYWETISGNDDGYVIVSFDLEVRRFEIIELNLDSFSSVLGVMGVCLSRWGYYRTNREDTVLHILESSTTMKSIYLPEELWINSFSQMIGFTKTGKIFVTGPLTNYDAWDDDESTITLQLLDIGRNPIQHSILMKFDGLVNIAKYVPTLASPFPN